MFERTRSMWRRLLGRPTSAQTTDTDDRRAYARHAADVQAFFKPAGSPNSSRLAARVRDISLCGINLLGSRAFEPGDMLSVELPGTSEPSESNVLACVVHCAVEKEGEWSLGCTFSRELSEEDLETFGARRERHDPSDQREWKRFPSKVTATFQVIGGETPSQAPANVVDISASGVGLVVDRIVENGALLSVELHNAAGTTEQTMLACVVHVTHQADNEWFLGCNFMRSLSEEDLRALA